MDAACAEGVDTESCGDGGIDPAGDSDDDVLEPALFDVVAQPEDQRTTHLLELGLEWCHHPIDRLRVLQRGAELDDVDRGNVLP